MDILNRLFSEILTNYSAKPREVFSSNARMAKAFNLLKSEIANAPPLRSRPHIKVHASYGKGNWVDVPWVVLTPDTVQDGLYPCILFREDMTGFYLCVGYGVTKIYDQLGKREAERQLSSLTSQYREILNEETKVKLGLDKEKPIDLKSDGKWGPKYEAGTIISKFYPADALPSDDTFLKDLETIFQAYESIKDTQLPAASSNPKTRHWVGAVNLASFYEGSADQIKNDQSWRKHRIVKWGDGKPSTITQLSDVRLGDYFAILGYTGTHSKANHYCSGRIVSIDPKGYLEMEIWDPELRGRIDLENSPTGKNIFEVTGLNTVEQIFGLDFSHQEPSYWAGGHVWLEVSQKDRFLKDSIWEHNFDLNDPRPAATKTFRDFSRIKPNDYFSIKGYGGRNHLTIYNVARVLEVVPEKNQVKLETLNIELYKGLAPSLDSGSWQSTLIDVVGEMAIETIFGKVAESLNKGTEMKEQEMQIPELNLILYGPPGTGKTYKLQEEYFPFFTRGDQKNYVMVTFHQSYGYEEFIEGLRPQLVNGQVTYEVEPGSFKRIAKRAENDPYNNYAIFIDEINRGNISKIFGELLTLLEEDKRKEPGLDANFSVELPYSKEQFSVPSNLFVIGTMNTADRSIALLDTALRRRFSFKEMMPNYDLQYMQKTLSGISLSELLKTLNDRIEYLYDREHVIGHAYFSKVNTLQDLKEVFVNKIIPLLQEYFFEDWEKTCQVLNSSVQFNKPPGDKSFALIEIKKIAPGLDLETQTEDKYSYRINSDFLSATDDLAQYFKHTLGQ
jgi:hypothetical protein